MKKYFLFGREFNSSSFALLAIMATPAFLGACSNAYERGSPLVAADEMKEGPGIFSGDKGGFFIAGGEEKGVASKPVSTVSKMNATETSKVIDERIERLKRDQIELEALKKALNKKVQNR